MWKSGFGSSNKFGHPALSSELYDDTLNAVVCSPKFRHPALSSELYDDAHNTEFVVAVGMLRKTNHSSKCLTVSKRIVCSKFLQNNFSREKIKILTLDRVSEPRANYCITCLTCWVSNGWQTKVGLFGKVEFSLCRTFWLSQY